MILDSCPETTLSQKYRDIIASKLNEPMAASDEIRKTKRNKKSATSGPVQQTSGSGSKPTGFVSSLVKILVYSSILIGLSSQFEATRPIYKEYAHPYVATYVQVSFRVMYVGTILKDFLSFRGSLSKLYQRISGFKISRN